MSIVMGIDQHRAQITAEWIELETGEIGRARVRPADRTGVRRFLSRFAGQQLEVATEATTGWRFLVEELWAAGAEVHLAEPAETTALRGNKKHATHQGTCRAKGRRRCAGRCMRPRRSRVIHARRIAPTTSRRPSTWAATAPAWRSRASCSSAAITRCASSATTRSRHRPYSRRGPPHAAPVRVDGQRSPPARVRRTRERPPALAA